MNWQFKTLLFFNLHDLSCIKETDESDHEIVYVLTEDLLATNKI